MVNLKAELEIRQLHTKIDILTTHQWEQMLEVLKTQSDMMGILMDKQGHPKS